MADPLQPSSICTHDLRSSTSNQSVLFHSARPSFALFGWTVGSGESLMFQKLWSLLVPCRGGSSDLMVWVLHHQLEPANTSSWVNSIITALSFLFLGQRINKQQEDGVCHGHPAVHDLQFWTCEVFLKRLFCVHDDLNSSRSMHYFCYYFLFFMLICFYRNLALTPLSFSLCSSHYIMLNWMFTCQMLAAALRSFHFLLCSEGA